MNKQNRKVINDKVLDYAPRMQPLLPEHPSHPHGRRAYAHMYDVMKRVFGCPIDQVRDERLQDALDILDYCMDNATEMSVATPLRKKYAPEPKPSTLDDFFND